MRNLSRGTRATVGFLFGFVALVGGFLALFAFATTWGGDLPGVSLALFLTGLVLMVAGGRAALQAMAGTLERSGALLVGVVGGLGAVLYAVLATS